MRLVDTARQRASVNKIYDIIACFVQAISRQFAIDSLYRVRHISPAQLFVPIRYFVSVKQTKPAADRRRQSDAQSTSLIMRQRSLIVYLVVLLSAMQALAWTTCTLISSQSGAPVRGFSDGKCGQTLLSASANEGPSSPAREPESDCCLLCEFSASTAFFLFTKAGVAVLFPQSGVSTATFTVSTLRPRDSDHATWQARAPPMLG
jgi:hypothetical protein